MAITCAVTKHQHMANPTATLVHGLLRVVAAADGFVKAHLNHESECSTSCHLSAAVNAMLPWHCLSASHGTLPLFLHHAATVRWVFHFFAPSPFALTVTVEMNLSPEK